MNGYQGVILRVDLSTGSVTREPLDPAVARQYLGGKGLAIKYLYDELAEGIDALSPDNKLVVMNGPLCGTAAPLSGKLAIAAKSPATGTILDCSIGGHIGAVIKFAGYDGIIVEGKANAPVYLNVVDDEIRIESAEKYWGKGSQEVELALKEESGEGSEVLAIGIAGENLVPFSCINTDLYRQAGRGGIGAVMGSKNLKAIVVKGSKPIAVADKERFLTEVNAIFRKTVEDDHNGWAFADGTTGNVALCNAAGCLPTHNFQDGSFKDFAKISAEAMLERRKHKKGCFACALGCGNFVKNETTAVEGPEYETLALTGSNCGIADFDAVMAFNNACDDLGLDTISAGNVVGFAMEMTERGIHDYGIGFGNVEKYLEMPQLIASCSGVGAELAKGVKYLGEKHGQEDCAMHTKGLEFPGYDPRGAWGMSLTYATADRGACHLRSYTVLHELLAGSVPARTFEGKSKLVADMQIMNGAKFSMIYCDFFDVSYEDMATIYNCVVGGDEMTVEELKTIGNRVATLARLYNMREGFSKKDDTLPRRLFKKALKSGATKGVSINEKEFKQMLDSYYDYMGWDRDGCPGAAHLEAVGL